MSASYNMAKSAMEALALTLAKEEREHGIRVNIVAPGVVRAGMGLPFVAARGEELDDLERSSPFGRMCTAEDVANVVRWLVSDGASYITGERLQINGGGQWA